MNSKHSETGEQDVKSKSTTAQSTSPTNIFNQPWATTWRKAVVSLPRAVPDAVLRFTSPEGPHPIVIKMPSRKKTHELPLYVFIPPSVSTESTTKADPRTSVQPQKFPVLLDFHGGGFILGSCQEQAPFCAKMSRDLNCIVITVDYRLGPAAQFPAAVHDAEDVLSAIIHPLSNGYYVLRNSINTTQSKSNKPRIEIDTSKIALSGFSSGGSLAYNLVLSVDADTTQLELSKDWPSPFNSSHQTPIPTLLFYPALDTRLLPNERPLPPGMSAAPPSFWTSLNLEGELMPTYLPKELTTHPRASPGLVHTSASTSTSTSLPKSTAPNTNTEEPQAMIIGKGTLHPSAKFLAILPALDTLSASNEAWITSMHDHHHNANEILTVERVLGVLHGWTQFPDGFLDEDAKVKKKEVFELAVRFVKELWNQ